MSAGFMGGSGCTARAYGVRRMPAGHRGAADGHVLVCAGAAVVGAWQGTAVGLALAVVLWLLRAPHRVMALAVVLAFVGDWRADAAWEGTEPRHLGAFEGWAEVAADPAVYGRGLRVTFEIEGERFDAWCYGPLRRALAERQQGEVVWLRAERQRLAPRAARRAAVRHVVGALDLEYAADVLDGTAVARAGNRVRGALRGAAEGVMDDGTAALFTGLVIGDDRRQTEAVVGEFRASGLSHLTAVSGQNVAFLLAAASPVLRRLRPWWRWAATVALIGWFMSVTRFEPSVLRAGVMAILAASAFLSGRQARPARLVGLAVTGLVLLDPLLVWSVGFWLSVGATLGVSAVGPWLGERMPGPLWLRVPLGVTLGAQVGVALPSVLVFGRLPLVSVPANLVAVPVAGFVMLYGIPAGLLAAALPAPMDALVLWPATAGTRWVALVAKVGAAVEPAPQWAFAGWVAAGALMLALLRHRHPRRRPVGVRS